MKNIQTKRNLEFGIAKNEQLNTDSIKNSNVILYSNGCHKGKVLKNLLKENNFKISTAEFNNEMRNQGYLEKRSRRGKNGVVKHFNSLTSDGLRFGENAISPYNQRETQPLYYKDTFRTLFFEIFKFPRQVDLK